MAAVEDDGNVTEDDEHLLQRVKQEAQENWHVFQAREPHIGAEPSRAWVWARLFSPSSTYSTDEIKQAARRLKLELVTSLHPDKHNTDDRARTQATKWTTTLNWCADILKSPALLQASLFHDQEGKRESTESEAQSDQEALLRCCVDELSPLSSDDEVTSLESVRQFFVLLCGHLCSPSASGDWALRMLSSKSAWDHWFKTLLTYAQSALNQLDRPCLQYNKILSRHVLQRASSRFRLMFVQKQAGQIPQTAHEDLPFPAHALTCSCIGDELLVSVSQFLATFPHTPSVFVQAIENVLGGLDTKSVAVNARVSLPTFRERRDFENKENWFEHVQDVCIDFAHRQTAETARRLFLVTETAGEKPAHAKLSATDVKAHNSERRKRSGLPPVKNKAAKGKVQEDKKRTAQDQLVSADATIAQTDLAQCRAAKTQTEPAESRAGAAKLEGAESGRSAAKLGADGKKEDSTKRGKKRKRTSRELMDVIGKFKELKLSVHQLRELDNIVNHFERKMEDVAYTTKTSKRQRNRETEHCGDRLYTSQTISGYVRQVRFLCRHVELQKLLDPVFVDRLLADVINGKRGRQPSAAIQLLQKHYEPAWKLKLGGEKCV